MLSAILQIPLKSAQRVDEAWRAARAISRLLGLDDFAGTRLATAVAAIALDSEPAAVLEFAIDPPALIVRMTPCLTPPPDLICGLVDRCEFEPGSSTLRLETMLPEGGPPADHVARAVALELAREDPVAELDRARQEISLLSQELEDTNRGVTALYTELDQRTAQLRHVGELKSRFMSNLSHEVRTPVNSILALCGILLRRLDGPLTAEQEKQLVYIRESAQQLFRLVADELDLAKVEAGKISLTISDFHVGDVFGALRGMFKPLVQNPDVSLILEEPSDLPALRTDEGKIAQILRNLISNALKFTQRGEVRVTARFLSDADSIEFKVADTGIGLSPADQARIFEEFYQAPTAARDRGEGAGLGLHLSMQLAKLLGGKLAVTSELHAGAVFTAVIPVVMPSAEQPAAAPAAGPVILVIDDDHHARYLVKQNIGEINCRVVEAVSGAEGLFMIRKHHPCLIFLDLVMPELTGFDVLRELRAAPETRDIPVVMLTSKVLDDEEKRRLGSQVSAIVNKAEISREMLRRMIDTWRADNLTREVLQ